MNKKWKILRVSCTKFHSQFQTPCIFLSEVRCKSWKINTDILISNKGECIEVFIFFDKVRILICILCLVFWVERLLYPFSSQSGMNTLTAQLSIQPSILPFFGRAWLTTMFSFLRQLLFGLTGSLFVCFFYSWDYYASSSKVLKS